MQECRALRYNYLMNERPQWMFDKELKNGKRHDNPNHAGMRSHKRRMAEANQTALELPEGLKLSQSARSTIKRLENQK